MNLSESEDHNFYSSGRSSTSDYSISGDGTDTDCGNNYANIV